MQMDTSPPSEMEVMREMGFLKRDKAAGSDGLSPSLFKDDDEVLTSELRKLLGSIGPREEISKDCSELVIVLICKKGDRSTCENHRGMGLVNTAFKLLAGIILRRLSGTRERCMHEDQAGFPADRGYMYQIFTL